MTEATTSSSSQSWKYDVFLSFHGKDTRKKFVDHLYSALEQHGILTYKDDVTLARGDTIEESILKAIEESHIALIIFSEHYADSSWCLDELLCIMKCIKEKRGQIVMPIFYNVEPSDVGDLKGEFCKALAKHNNTNVESWKKALVDASNISGWVLANGHEAKFIQEIVNAILKKMASLNSDDDNEDLVGIETRLQELKSHLRIGSGDVHMVGIWGVGGGGKTTLATSLYMEMVKSGHFDGYCLVENIREVTQQKGLKSLQEQILLAIFDKEIKVQSVDIGKRTIKNMLYRRKVFIVLDDVDHHEQLKALAGSCKWFGDGSRIIIATRDEHLLKTHRVNDISPISLLSREEAIELFKKHAYDEDNPVDDYEMLSQQIISYAGGLPLALCILGSFLYDKSHKQWLDALGRLKNNPEMNILKTLRISYDGLTDLERKLFLEIACFYKRSNSNMAIQILDACGFHPIIGVKVLKQKALITVSPSGAFDMHDLVQEMGHYIVRGEHPNNPEKHSRVWRHEDFEDICLRNATMDNDKIEAIECFADNFSSRFIAISNMKNLRFLKVKLKTILPENDEWERDFESLIPESFQPKKLVVLKVVFGFPNETWKGYKYLPSSKELQLFYTKTLFNTTSYIGGLQSIQTVIGNDPERFAEIQQAFGNPVSLDQARNVSSILRTRNLGTIPIKHKPGSSALAKFLAKK